MIKKSTKFLVFNVCLLVALCLCFTITLFSSNASADDILQNVTGTAEKGNVEGELVLDSFVMDDGGSIRYSDPIGIRYITSISKTDIDKLPDNAVFGTYFVAEEYKNRSEKFIDCVATKWAEESTVDLYKYKSVLAGKDQEEVASIASEWYGKNIIGKSYVKYVDKNEAEHIIYAGNSQSRSMLYIASSALKDDLKDNTVLQSICTTALSSFGDSYDISTYSNVSVGKTYPLFAGVSTTSGIYLNPTYTSDNDKVTISSVGGKDYFTVADDATGTVTITADLMDVKASFTAEISDENAYDIIFGSKGCNSLLVPLDSTYSAGDLVKVTANVKIDSSYDDLGTYSRMYLGDKTVMIAHDDMSSYVGDFKQITFSTIVVDNGEDDHLSFRDDENLPLLVGKGVHINFYDAGNNFNSVQFKDITVEKIMSPDLHLYASSPVVYAVSKDKNGADLIAGDSVSVKLKVSSALATALYNTVYYSTNPSERLLGEYYGDGSFYTDLSVLNNNPQEITYTTTIMSSTGNNYRGNPAYPFADGTGLHFMLYAEGNNVGQVVYIQVLEVEKAPIVADYVDNGYGRSTTYTAFDLGAENANKNLAITVNLKGTFTPAEGKTVDDYDGKLGFYVFHSPEGGAVGATMFPDASIITSEYKEYVIHTTANASGVIYLNLRHTLEAPKEYTLNLEFVSAEEELVLMPSVPVVYAVSQDKNGETLKAGDKVNVKLKVSSSAAASLYNTVYYTPNATDRLLGEYYGDGLFYPDLSTLNGLTEEITYTTTIMSSTGNNFRGDPSYPFTEGTGLHFMLFLYENVGQTVYIQVVEVEKAPIVADYVDNGFGRSTTYAKLNLGSDFANKKVAINVLLKGTFTPAEGKIFDDYDGKLGFFIFHATDGSAVDSTMFSDASIITNEYKEYVIHAKANAFGVIYLNLRHTLEGYAPKEYTLNLKLVSVAEELVLTPSTPVVYAVSKDKNGADLIAGDSVSVKLKVSSVSATSTLNTVYYTTNPAERLLVNITVTVRSILI